MKKIIHAFLLCSILVFLLTGATCPRQLPDPPSSDKTPAKTLAVFREALDNHKYTTAFNCLSQNSQNRYPKEQFEMMLQWTIFGILLRNLLIKWDVVGTKYDSQDKYKAMVTLRHNKRPEYQKDFIFVYEEEEWRIDITIARLLGMPQEDEDSLFSPRKK